MCPQPGKIRTNELSFALEVLLMAKYVDIITVTGGEPTCLWDEFKIFLIEAMKKFPNATVEILTNGYVFHDYKKVKELSDIQIEKLNLAIPLYSDNTYDHDRIVCKKGAFRNTIESLYNLARINCSIEIRNVVSSYNYKRLAKWAEFLSKNIVFTKHIAIMQLEFEGRANKNQKNLWISPNEYENELFSCVQIIKNSGIPFSLYNYQLCLIKDKLRQYCAKSISEWKRVYLDTCESCKLKTYCGGIFVSTRHIIGKMIKSIY